MGGRSLGRHAWKCHLRASAAPFPARRFAHDKLKAAVLACSAGHRSSMVQDMDSGRRAEIDPLNGAVARLGKAHGVANPTHDALIALIKARQPG